MRQAEIKETAHYSQQIACKVDK